MVAIKRSKALIFSGIIFITLFVLCELGARWFFFSYRPEVHYQKPGYQLGCFGGSTTHGYNEDNSSWPSEMAVFMPGVEIINYAADGTNTKYALSTLINVVSDLDMVLWCNFVNDNEICLEKPSWIWVYRLSETCKRYIKSYDFIHEFIWYVRIRANILPQKGYQKEVYDWSLGFEQYKANTIKAIRLCQENDVKFAIVRLPSPAESSWTTGITNIMKDLSNEFSVQFLNIAQYYIDNGIPCPKIHQLRKGHIETARFIAQELEL